jgi:hypothetical protein
MDSSGSHAHHLRQIAECASDHLQLSHERSFEKGSRRASTTPRQGTGVGGGGGGGAVAASRSELELDQEATAALLMLNSDRRQWRGVGVAKAAGDDSSSRRSSGGGGMSVRDLLSG